MQHLFMDESGDLGFNGGSAYFILAFIAPQTGKTLSKCIKNFNAHLIRNDWNQLVEIKATNVWHARNNPKIPATYKYRNNPEIPMRYVLQSLAKIDGYIECAVVKLDTINPRLQTAPCAILYNHFSWQLLRGPLAYFPAVELCIDRRNREYHNMLKFRRLHRQQGWAYSGKVGEGSNRPNNPPLSLEFSR